MFKHLIGMQNKDSIFKALNTDSLNNYQKMKTGFILQNI